MLFSWRSYRNNNDNVFTWQVPVSSIGEKTGTSLEKLFFTDDDSAPLSSSTEESDTEREEDNKEKGTERKEHINKPPHTCEYSFIREAKCGYTSSKRNSPCHLLIYTSTRNM